MSIIYSKRQSVFTKEEHEWRVEVDALVIKAPPGKAPSRKELSSAESSISWKDVVNVRLAYAPGRFQKWRYVFVLQPKTGRKIEIDNSHYSGFAEFEDRSDTYVPFVRAALERIRDQAPQARAQIGSGIVSYVLNLLFVSAMFTILAILLIVIPTPLDFLSFSSFIKLGIIMVFLPVLYRWITKARPRGIKLDDIPPDALPKLK
jgi:hypothetical protein